MLGTPGIFLAASTVRNILLKRKPGLEGPRPVAARQPEQKQPRQIVARYPTHVWSVECAR